MSKMLVELANLYRQLIYIWDKGVESRGVRSQGELHARKHWGHLCDFVSFERSASTSGQKWAGQICNKVSEGGGPQGVGQGVSICRLCRRTCVVNIAIPWTIIMNEPRGCSPYSPSLSPLSFALHWIVATLCHLICCNLIDNLCNFNEHERFI